MTSGFFGILLDLASQIVNVGGQTTFRSLGVCLVEQIQKIHFALWLASMCTEKRHQFELGLGQLEPVTVSAYFSLTRVDLDVAVFAHDVDMLAKRAHLGTDPAL
jgi:hypothetical protein